jgi:two-component system, NarL family, nitrate/nitrite response regulator NarL
MADLPSKTTVGVCDTQPITTAGVQAVLSACPDMEYSWSVSSLEDGLRMYRQQPTQVVLADKGLGINGLLHWILNLRAAPTATAVVIWGSSLTEAEALRFVQAGAKGVIRKGVNAETLLACLRSAGSGSTWMEDVIFRTSPRAVRSTHSDLTPREAQVFGLVEQGLTNGEIARELGIRPGTVKIHLKRLYEKTGIRSRYHLALSGLRDKGLLTMTA